MTLLASPLQLSDPHSHYIGDPVAIEHALEKWLWADEVRKVSLTLLARPIAELDGRGKAQLSADEFSEAIRLLMMKLSRLGFGNRDIRRRGKRLLHAFVFESGFKKGLLHAHGWIECPKHMDSSSFCESVVATWKSLRFGDEADVTVRCDEGWVRYMLKRKTTGEAAYHIDLRNVFLP